MSERVVVVVQARMTSSRLPGKVLADVCGRPMLEHLIVRLRAARSVDSIVIATTDRQTDDPVCALARTLRVGVHRGSEDDVLERMVEAARSESATIVVRVTADCPLLDPRTVDRVVAALASDPRCDYASNVLERTFPQGLDVEAIRMKVLEQVESEARSKMAREHVTWHIVRERPDAFRCRSVTASDNFSELRWTVDTNEDLTLIRTLYAELELGERLLDYREILAHVLATPRLQEINVHVTQRHL